MSIRFAAAFAAILMLSGCSMMPDMTGLLDFPGDSDVADAPVPAAPAAVASAAPGAPDPFCAAVAGQDAQENAFDAATQQRMAQRSYQQCVTLHSTP